MSVPSVGCVSSARLSDVCDSDAITGSLHPGGFHIPVRTEYPSEAFRVIKLPDRCDKWNEVSAIEEGLKRTYSFIQEKDVKGVILPGRGASPLAAAFNILLPGIPPAMSVESLSKLGNKQPSYIEQLVRDDPKIQVIVEQSDRILVFDDGVESGKTLSRIRTAMNEVYPGSVIFTGALFMVNAGLRIQPDTRLDIFGAKVSHSQAPTWYFIKENPEAYSCEDIEDVLKKASLEILKIATNVAADLRIPVPCRPALCMQ